jgi:peptide/nickel transport system permease protein
MTNYIVTRVILLVITVIGVSFISFSAVRLIPGDLVDQLVTRGGYQGIKDRETLRKRMGLDRPVVIQYVDWMGRILRGDLGTSLRTGYPIKDDLKQRMPVTLELGILAITLGTLIGLPVGIISAIKQDTWIDYVLRSFTILMLSVPSYWIATMVILYLALWFGWSPPVRYTRLTDDPAANLQQMLLPALIAGVAGSAGLMRFARTAMLEVLRQDYLRTARAKGLTERIVIVRHALRNGLIPVITVLGLSMSGLLGGGSDLRADLHPARYGRIHAQCRQRS